MSFNESLSGTDASLPVFFLIRRLLGSTSSGESQSEAKFVLLVESGDKNLEEEGEEKVSLGTHCVVVVEVVAVAVVVDGVGSNVVGSTTISSSIIVVLLELALIL